MDCKVVATMHISGKRMYFSLHWTHLPLSFTYVHMFPQTRLWIMLSVAVCPYRSPSRAPKIANSESCRTMEITHVEQLLIKNNQHQTCLCSVTSRFFFFFLFCFKITLQHVRIFFSGKKKKIIGSALPVTGNSFTHPAWFVAAVSNNQVPTSTLPDRETGCS